ncbi:MAG: enoyl-CoA hydratase-related protein [Actinomycetota bacterium]|nr:enoyl-CoA hydratase-related protein [Actinomycetota bacterium]
MTIRMEVDRHVATITIDRPERLNALDSEAYSELAECWRIVESDDSIRVAVITGVGRSFCVGADIRAHPRETESWVSSPPIRLINTGLELFKPVIAGVNGFCLGGGLTMLLATDIRIAAASATFRLPEVARGLIPGNGGTQRLIEQIPYAAAMDLLLSGSTWDADTALRFGLVTEVVPDAELAARVATRARAMAELAPLALRAAKELALRSRSLHLTDGLRLESAALAHLRRSIDAREGALAFAEKRPAEYVGG